MNNYAYAEEAKISDHRQMKVSMEETKKPNFIKRWINNQVMSILDQRDRNRELNKVSSISISGLTIGKENTFNGDKGLSFTVFKASGGYIIKTAFFDNSKDMRDRTNLYIVHEDKDLGAEIGKIITLDCLRS